MNTSSCSFNTNVSLGLGDGWRGGNVKGNRIMGKWNERTQKIWGKLPQQEKNNCVTLWTQRGLFDLDALPCPPPLLCPPVPPDYHRRPFTLSPAVFHLHPPPHTTPVLLFILLPTSPSSSTYFSFASSGGILLSIFPFTSPPQSNKHERPNISPPQKKNPFLPLHLALTHKSKAIPDIKIIINFGSLTVCFALRFLR